MSGPPPPTRPPIPAQWPWVVDRVFAPAGCLLTFCVFLGLGAEPFYGHPSVVDLLLFVALPSAAAACWLIAAWRCVPDALRAVKRQPTSSQSRGFPLVMVVAAINAILLLAFVGAYLSDVATYGEMLRSARGGSPAAYTTRDDAQLRERWSGGRLLPDDRGARSR